MNPYTYCLYDIDDLPVLVTNSIHELADYLEQKNINVLQASVYRAVTRPDNNGNVTHKIKNMQNGKIYLIYRYTEKEMEN